MFGAFKSYRYRPGRLVRCQSVLRLTMGLRILHADVYCLRPEAFQHIRCRALSGSGESRHLLIISTYSGSLRLCGAGRSPRGK